MDADVKGFGRVVGLSGERLRYYKRIMAFFNKYATFHFEAYNSTDDVTNPQTNVIYLVGPKGNLDDKYEEYIYDNTKQDPWIKIGDTSIDLSQYATVAELIEELSNYTTTEDLNELLSKKQNTEEGKGLSTNDFTDNLKGKLDGIQSGAQKNVNADWNSESGDSQILNKPDLSGFITKTVNDLTNYYLKSEVYTKDQVAAIIATINQFHYEVHPTLNEIVSPQNNVLYLIGPTGTGSDKYEEYIYPDVETGWTKIGDTSIDLRNYVTIDTLNNALATKQDVISDLITIRAGAAAGATALQTIDENLTEQEFVYRICPSTINPKSIILDKIKGKTLVWNQLIKNGNFSNGTTNWYGNNITLSVSNNILTCTITNTAAARVSQELNDATISGHKYILSAYIKGSKSGLGISFGVGNSSGGSVQSPDNTETSGNWERLSGIFTANDSYQYFKINYALNVSVNDTIEVKNVFFIDLTLMFGAGNEPATVEEFESLFPGYHDYNAGKLISNDAKEIETVGFNQWDEEWEVGSFSEINGEFVYQYNTKQIRCKNFIPCLPNTEYFFNNQFNVYIQVAYFDANKEYIRFSTAVRNVPFTDTTPSNCYYMKFRTNEEVTSYSNNFCINISDPAKNGTYEPYKKSKINLNLNSFKVKDSQGNIITISGGLKSAGSVHDEIIGNKYIKRIGEVDLGTLTWTKQNTVNDGYRFYCQFNDDKSNNIICSKYNVTTSQYTYMYSNITGIAINIGTKQLVIADMSYADAATFKTAMSGVMLYYELATPIEYELIEPIVPITKAGITEARISPNVDDLSAPFCGDITYTLADIYVPESKSTNYITEITWSELKSLRDGGDLIPGMQYRITDYQCTTIQANTQSANHQFDIIVIADDVNKLNENARACLHEGDTYFASTKFESWKLKYRLDNDTTEFEWADATNGKGIIYWMKDEWNNECPYDFKNIQYKNSNKWVYTFNNSIYDTDMIDGSLQGYTNQVFENVIKSYIPNKKSKLSFNVFLGYNCHDNILKNNCSYNKFANGCKENILNIECYNNIFSTYCTNNILGNKCSNNNIAGYCDNNILGNECSNNVFQNYCTYNVFENKCSSNNLNDYCTNNIFNISCTNNSLGSYSSFNSFKTYCNNNTLAKDCVSLTFGNNCTDITIQKHYTNNIIFENNVRFITLTTSQTISISNRLQNIKFAQCVNSTNTVKTISHDTVNDIFQTIYKPANSVEIEV